jgi:predicted DNA-binding WGR domain protein
MRRFEYMKDGSAKFWQIEQRGRDVELSWGRIGTKGQTKTKPFSTQREARNEHDRAIAEKLAEGYLEHDPAVTSLAAEHAAIVAKAHVGYNAAAGISNPDVATILDAMRMVGTSIKIGKRSSESDVAEAERVLGFALPAEYREFVKEVGAIALEHDRTWLFYGLASLHRAVR